MKPVHVNRDEKEAVIWFESTFSYGHIKVTSLLTRALQDEGYHVTILTSEETARRAEYFPFGEAEFITLPDVGKRYAREGDDPEKIEWVEDTAYVPIDDPDGTFKAERLRQIKQVLDERQPDAFITELWPFGRGYHTPELTDVMEHIHASEELPQILDHVGQMKKRPLVYSLARDIPVVSPKLTPEMIADFVKRYYDGVLIRGENDFRFTEMDYFKNTDIDIAALESKLHYTGHYVLPPRDKTPMPFEEREVLVSLGGGYKAGSTEMYKAVMDARTHSSLNDRTWRIVIGNGVQPEVFDELAAYAREIDPDGIIVQHAVPHEEFRQMLSDAALYFGQVTYSAMMEAVTAGTPTVMTPFIYDFEMVKEHEIRSQLLSEYGITEVRKEQLSNPEVVGALIDAEFDKGLGNSFRRGTDYNGPSNAARLIARDVLRRDTIDMADQMLKRFPDAVAEFVRTALAPEAADLVVATLSARQDAAAELRRRFAENEGIPFPTEDGKKLYIQAWRNPPVGNMLMITREQDNELQILFGEKTITLEGGEQSFMALPGGHFDTESHENLDHALVAELFEETGLVLYSERYFRHAHDVLKEQGLVMNQLPPERISYRHRPEIISESSGQFANPIPGKIPVNIGYRIHLQDAHELCPERGDDMGDLHWVSLKHIRFGHRPANEAPGCGEDCIIYLGDMEYGNDALIVSAIRRHRGQQLQQAGITTPPELLEDFAARIEQMTGAPDGSLLRDYLVGPNADQYLERAHALHVQMEIAQHLPSREDAPRMAAGRG